MEVQFRRSGTRRYGIRILRPGLPVFEKDPAPGYDDLLPHDLIHLVVERELGLQQGIFGQVAAGGTAGTFLPVESDARTKREAARQRRSLNRRSDKLLQAGRKDSALSEAGVYIARKAWEARRMENARKKSPLFLTPRVGPMTAEQLTQICDELDVLSDRWIALAMGDSLTLQWPR
jgi:hypothetical protein